jgi:hypothetical protein
VAGGFCTGRGDGGVFFLQAYRRLFSLFPNEPNFRVSPLFPDV